MAYETCGIPEACICGRCDKVEPEPDYIDPSVAMREEIDRLTAELADYYVRNKELLAEVTRMEDEIDTFLREAEANLQERARLATEVKMLKKHWSAIEVFISDGSTDLSEFAGQFPRTWNALKADDYMTFDLPDTASGSPTPSRDAKMPCPVCYRKFTTEGDGVLPFHRDRYDINASCPGSYKFPNGSAIDPNAPITTPDRDDSNQEHDELFTCSKCGKGTPPDMVFGFKGEDTICKRCAYVPADSRHEPDDLRQAVHELLADDMAWNCPECLIGESDAWKRLVALTTADQSPTHWEKDPEDDIHCVHCGLTWDMHIAGSNRCSSRATDESEQE